MKKPKLRFKTVILSDIHMGAQGCRIEEVNFLMKHTRCEKLILNGDIIDTWQLKKSGVWTKKHSRFVRLALQKIAKHNTRIIYLRGNHDDLLERFLPMSFANISIVEQHVHNTPNGAYLVVHGDIFDAITTQFKWLAKLGDVGYNMLLTANRWYNNYRAWRGLEYYSFSAAIKAKVKGAVNFISSFETTLVDLAKTKGYTGVICGHIHSAADKMIDGVHYLNSGDWVESLTCLVEHYDGRFEVLDYQEFCRRVQVRQVEREEEKNAKAALKQSGILTGTAQIIQIDPSLVTAGHPTEQQG